MPTDAPASSPLPSPSRTLLTVKQLALQQPGLAEGGIRHAIFNEDTNGLAQTGAVVRFGRRVLIDPDMFVQWIAGNPKLCPTRPPKKASAAAPVQVAPTPKKSKAKSPTAKAPAAKKAPATRCAA